MAFGDIFSCFAFLLSPNQTPWPWWLSMVHWHWMETQTKWSCDSCPFKFNVKRQYVYLHICFLKSIKFMNILCYVQTTKKYLSHCQFLINLEELVQILKQKVLNYYNLSDLYLFIYCSKNVIKNWLGHFFIYLFVCL